jgi:hypothetical protein
MSVTVPKPPEGAPEAAAQPAAHGVWFRPRCSTCAAAWSAMTKPDIVAAR